MLESEGFVWDAGLAGSLLSPLAPTTNIHFALCPILCLLPALLPGIRKECYHQAGTKGHTTSIAIPRGQGLVLHHVLNMQRCRSLPGNLLVS